MLKLLRYTGIFDIIVRVWTLVTSTNHLLLSTVEKCVKNGSIHCVSCIVNVGKNLQEGAQKKILEVKDIVFKDGVFKDGVINWLKTASNSIVEVIGLTIQGYGQT